MTIRNIENRSAFQSVTTPILTVFASIGLLFAAIVSDSNQARAESENERQARVVHTYKCQDGTSLRVRFDNTGNYSIAILDLGQVFEIPLIETVSGSGARYTNEDYTLHTKNDEAVFTKQDYTAVCSAG